MVSNQLAMLVPGFDPSSDDVTVWSGKVQLLAEHVAQGQVERACHQVDSWDERINVPEASTEPNVHSYRNGERDTTIGGASWRIGWSNAAGEKVRTGGEGIVLMPAERR